MWRALGSLFGAALAFGPRLAWAGAPAVHLEVEACQSLDARSIQRIFAADLGTPITTEKGPDVTEVSIRCEGERVTVRVRDPISRKTVKRSFDPKSFGNEAESRIIAIAASELVLASWAELAANPKPKVSPDGPAPSAVAVETARSVVRARSASETAPAPAAPPPAGSASTRVPVTLDGPRGEQPAADPRDFPEEDARAARGRATQSSPIVFDRVTGVISFRSFPAGDGTLWGGGVRYGRERYGVVSFAGDVLIENGTLARQAATSASLGGWLCFYANAGPATFRLGGGLRAGVLAQPGGPTGAIWGWPMLVASQSLRFRSLVIELSGEGGFVNVLVQPGKPGLRGGWASGQVGIGVAL